MMGRLHIYVVTCMRLDPECGNPRRAWGWFPTFEAADECVRQNDADIFENDYTHAVIEAMPWGSLAMADAEWWYRARRDDDGQIASVERAEKPASLAGTVSFGMG